jgi:hypothetical protein
MKITTNFVHSPARLARPLATGLWVLVSMAALTGLSLWHAAIDLRNEIPDLRERLAQLDQRRLDLATQPVLPAAELRQLKQRVTALNDLSSNRGRSVGLLLADLEQWLPDQAWLVSLHDRAKAGEVLIVAESASAEPLTVFLLRLEQQTRRFSEVLLVKQTPQGASRNTIQFEIRLKERT